MACLMAAQFLAGCAVWPQQSRPIVRKFSSDHVSRVILRASAVKAATVTNAKDAAFVTVTGIPSGGNWGYHSSDPDWRETPASEWGLDFFSRRFGSTLVISTKNEIGYIHDQYTLEGIKIQLPASVKLIRETRKLTGDGAPDLSPP